jgi:alpha-1,2-mannosyltransferase
MHGKNVSLLATGALVIGALAFATALTLTARSAAHWATPDLWVYRHAGLTALNSGQLYAASFGKAEFSYPPFAALLFEPMAISFTQVKWIMTVLSMLALAVSAWAALGAAGLRAPAPAASRAVRTGAALAVAVAALWLEPVMSTLGWGQIDLVLMALVLADMCMREDRWWHGAGVGVAAGIKLTPLIFVPYLLLTRRFRAALVALIAFGLTIAVSFIVLPGQAGQFWLTGRFVNQQPVDGNNPAMLPNQSLAGMLARVAGGVPGNGGFPWLVAVGTTGVVGLLLATLAHRQGFTLLGVATCALTGLLVSPVSWDHHWVWVLPLLVAAVALVRERMISGRGPVAGPVCLAVLGAPFLDYPDFSDFPASHDPRLNGLLFRYGHSPDRWHGMLLLIGNLYVLAGLGMLCAIALIIAESGTPTAGYPGRWSSMTASTDGSSGSVLGRNRATTDPSGASRNFSKFHWMSPASPSASGNSVSSW